MLSRLACAWLAMALLPLPAYANDSMTAPDAAAEMASERSGTLLVGNKGENTVSFIDLATGEEIARRETGEMPHEIALSPDGSQAAIVSYGGHTISIFDVASATRVEILDLTPNARPHGIAWLADGRIMATTEGSDTLTIATPGTAGWAISSIATGNEGSHMLAVTDDGSRAYVANLSSRNVTAIDVATGTVLADLEAGTEPEGIALSRDGSELWVSARGSDEVYVFATDTLAPIARIDVGGFPIRIAISPDGRTAITSNLTDGSLSLIDTASKTVRDTIIVSGQAQAQQVTLLFSSDGTTLYAAETGPDQIAEIDLESGTVTRRLPAGADGDGLGISPVRVALDD